MTTWITDDKGNRASVEHWGSEDAAKASLATLTDCSDCSDCSRCSRCSDCSGCSDCSDCSGCSDCSDCSGCSDCSDCSGCSRCSRCSGCSSKNDHAAEAMPPIPKIENIDKVVYAAASQPNALNMSDWHTCETTHCRAGWVVHLAGEQGYALEQFFNTELAAMLIYRESGAPISPVKFHETNEAAMADMKERAEEAA